MTPSMKELFEKARATRENSYSPYSQYKVGSAIRTADGKIFSGCNIENSSYGATICAERTAIFKAVSECGSRPLRIEEIIVVTDATPPWPPCGMCRQVLAEFSTPTTLIHAANLNGEIVSTNFATLMPQAFTPEHLGKK